MAKLGIEVFTACQTDIQDLFEALEPGQSRRGVGGVGHSSWTAGEVQIEVMIKIHNVMQEGMVRALGGH